MQKRAGVRGSKKKKFFYLICLLFTAFCFFTFFPRETVVREREHDSKIVEDVPEGFPISKAYRVQPIKCFSLDCRLKNNARAYGKSTEEEATNFNDEGVKILESLFVNEKVTLENVLEKAEEKFLEAIKTSDNYHRAYANLALVKFAQGKEEKAIDYINKAIEYKKNVAEYYSLRAFFREKIGSPEDYAEDLKNAELLEPQIGIGRYYGIIMTNDTRTNQHKSFPLVRSFDTELEQSMLSKFLLWVEFSPISFLEHAKITTEMTQFFIQNRYIAVKQLIPTFIKDITKDCYKAFSERNLMINGDLQTSHREVIYNDRCGRYLQFALTDTIRAIVHNNVIPSYTYAGLYSPGAIIGPHLDRQQCEFTVSIAHLQIPNDQPWAIGFGRKWTFDKDSKKGSSIAEHMPPEDEIEFVNLFEGDGLILMGRHLVHFRNKSLPEGHRTHNSFLHYVANDWTGSLD